MDIYLKENYSKFIIEILSQKFVKVEIIKVSEDFTYLALEMICF